ncbi:hypothetical protein [Pseudomonas rhodesiae]|uniref:Aminotransferase n=1 Tax=Pseudomonas rhodesiae TaxID=76760 RepID=A0AAE8HET9_9PSED|nr:hypothetical protein [Pseudomonas rhodesiae]TWR57246.1 hypothetical protein FIV35_06595 [Pseudomonas rhodesiae]SDV13177.1 hypothetical protein SAMN04490209_3818 [Pseudomonas rhodesiae]
MSTRREFLTYASLAARLPALNPTALAAEHASPFSFEQLVEQAQADALKSYSYPSNASAARLARLADSPAHALAS